MTGLEKRDRFAPSKTPYAIDLESFRKDRYVGFLVDVMWAGRKHGVTTISLGTLSAHSRGNAVIKTVEDFIEKVDMRYGGQSYGKWDGDALITPWVGEAWRALTIATLAPALEALPAVPKGYDGWYYRR